MNLAFRQEREASAELEDAALWYENQRPHLGLEFVQAVDHTLAQIAELAFPNPKVARFVSPTWRFSHGASRSHQAPTAARACWAVIHEFTMREFSWRP